MSTVKSATNSLRNFQAARNVAAQRANPFDIPSNHRLLAAESALKFLYGETGLMGVPRKNETKQ